MALRTFEQVLVLLALVLVWGCRTADYNRPLPEGAPALIPLGPNEPWPDVAFDWRNRAELLPALERSIEWTKKPSAPRYFPMAGITHEQALASLQRMREILESSPSAQAFARALKEEFVAYKSAGWNGRGGGVLFTGYCTPILEGSLRPGPAYDWPLYALPPDLLKGPEGAILGRQTEGGVEPYPTRRAIEAGNLLEGKGLELVWLRSPLDAFIAHVNGSAFVRLEDGEMFRLGYSGKNGQPYTSLGQALVREKKMKASEVSLPAVRKWASKAPPEEVSRFLRKNDSYVFFTPIDGTPRGSLNVEVTPDRTIATDKTLFPRGAVVFVDAELPGPGGRGITPFRKFMLDQDTGGAIRTAGRADLYLGIGEDAERRAGSTRSEGQLYYFFLKPRS